MAVPVLSELTYTPQDGHCNVKLTWHAVKGAYYQVLRKESGKSYMVAATVHPSSSTGVYYAKAVGKNKPYTYTVRRILYDKKKRIKAYSDYDKAGLTLLALPNVSATFTNRNAVIKWN